MPFKAIFISLSKRKLLTRYDLLYIPPAVFRIAAKKKTIWCQDRGQGLVIYYPVSVMATFFVRAEWPLLKRGGAYCRKCGFFWQAHHCSRMQIWDVNSNLAFMFKFNSAVLYPYNYNTDLICYSPNIHEFLNLKQRKFQKQGETCYVNLVLIK